jgi:multimeric flavodoxin WrbA
MVHGKKVSVSKLFLLFFLIVNKTFTSKLVVVFHLKILAINSSPVKKGNSFHAIEQLKESMSFIGDVDFSTIALRDMDLQMCKGCSNCFKKGESFCPLKDDRDIIIEAMLKQDGIIFVTPVYAGQITALMKIFLERLAYFNHRPEFFNTFVMIVVSSGGTGQKATMNYLAANLKTWGFKIPIKFSFIAGKQKDSYTSDARKKLLIDKANKFFRTVKANKSYKPSLYDLSFYMAWKLTVKTYMTDIPADYQYWKVKGWLDEKRYFYTDASASFFKRFLARKIAYNIHNRLLRKEV